MARPAFDDRHIDLDVTSGIPGTATETEMMLGRDGKILGDPSIVCYATARADRKAPAFPGVSGNLRGVAPR
jgi:hypothetical protein